MSSIEKINRYILEQIANSSIDEDIAFQVLKEINKDKEEKSTDIAIIGMACRFPGAENKEEYWKNLKKGACLICEYPTGRKKDFEAYLHSRNLEKSSAEPYGKGGYLREVDKFGTSFFRVSPKEAKYMDPSQRLFLETAWEAIEDAGYGGNKIYGSNTGVFVGKDHTHESLYKYLTNEPDSMQLTGSVAGILASRISYIFNLRGPSMVIDTACSSGLVALHNACRALKNGECDFAIAGGIHVSYAPNSKDDHMNMIQSSDDVIRAFDKNAKGTVWGEGVGAVLLKPLDKAITDRDNIYAVIKGSAINNDGASNGITAPNPEAQEDVIVKAWQEAKINPETIDYIETHGTGTELGDPIEIKGLTNAFRRYTDKKQFCLIGSVKPNIGHLVGASGIASLFKVVLALKNGEIPETINFIEPSPHIDFTNSPVCVNNKLKEWKKKNSPKTAGVSAFGFSGTNCHVVLEEAPETEMNEGQAGDVEEPDILTLSAKSKKALTDLVLGLWEFLKEKPQLEAGDISYTVNTGRGHYNFRIAFIFRNREELCNKLDRLSSIDYDDLASEEQIYYKQHKIVTARKEMKSKGELTEGEKEQLSKIAEVKIKETSMYGKGNESILDDICRLYTEGADIEWEELYKGKNRRRVSLPVYPLERIRCWIEPEEIQGSVSKDFIELKHPLIDSCLNSSITQDVYITDFSIARHWVLSEHKIAGKSAIPGVTYLEMARALARRYYPDGSLEFKDFNFFTPLAVNETETREAHSVIKKCEGHLEFEISSKLKFGADDDWITHAEGKIYSITDIKPDFYSIENLKNRCNEKEAVSKHDLNEPEPDEIRKEKHLKVFEWGPRWRNFNRAFIGKDEILVEVELAQKYHGDMKEYILHPALLDNGANIVPFSIGEGVYLPYSYKNIKIFDDMPVKFYCYFRRKQDVKETTETITFDISFINEDGKAFIEVENYSVKKVHEAGLKLRELTGQNKPYYDICWVEEKLEKKDKRPFKDVVLLLIDSQGVSESLIEKIKGLASEVIEVEIGGNYVQRTQNRFTVNGTEEDYLHLIGDIKEQKIDCIIHISSILGTSIINSIKELETVQERGIYSVFRLTRALLKMGYRQEVDMVLISDCASRITGTEATANPAAAAMFGLGKVIAEEYTNLKCRCIDIDAITSTDYISDEIFYGDGAHLVAYRQGKRFIQEFREIRVENKEKSEYKIKDSGIYVVTGGMGGIGLVMAGHIASKCKVKLAFINRSEVPDRDKWDEILEENTDRKLCDKIGAMKKLEGLGAEIVCYSADVSKEDEITGIIVELRERFGRINGVIHCAGVAGDGFVINKDEREFNKVIDPKIKGTWLLNELTKEDKPDFFVMFSSIASITGGKGQGDYTAANAYLDSFAAFNNNSGKRVFAINWPAWNETGMAVDYGVAGDEGLFKSVSTASALEYFEELLNSGRSNAVVGRLNYKVIKSIGDSTSFRLSEQIISEIERYRVHSSYEGATKAPEKAIKVNVKGREDKSYTQIETKLAGLWAQVLGLEEIDVYENFHDMGGDSILATQLLKSIEKEYAGMIGITDIFAYPSVVQMAEYISKKKGETVVRIAQVSEKSSESGKQKDIAIIGMACRFPEADNTREFWNNLKGNVNSIRSFPVSRAKGLVGFYDENAGHTDKRESKMGYLNEIDKFDASFFRISPREAMMMEPAQRLFLEIAWEAIEDAGYGGNSIYGTRTGVYAGIAFKPQYSQLISEPDLLAFTGSMTGAVASRMSYIMNLSGPSMVIDTACSSGMVSLHEACKALKNNECTMALAGGINVFISPDTYEGLGEVESDGGELRAFDNRATGTVWGEGVGVVLLKPLDKAITDKDNIYAVIKGSAVNNDGASNGLTAPNPEAQTDVLIRAWEDSGIEPETISYIETHGTGTSLGDPIEIKGITDAFNQYTDKKQFCGIGSVKTNIGHTVGASGIASLIKVVLALKYNEIPATLNFKEPNAYINFNDSPVYMNDMLRKWERGETNRRAGISAFGFTGTNCHVVIEDPPEISDEKEACDSGLKLLALSAKSKTGLKHLIQKYNNYLTEETDAGLKEICYTANTGRGHYNYRLVVIIRDKKELAEKLKKAEQTDLIDIDTKGIYYGEHRVVPGNKKVREKNEIIDEEKRRLSTAAKGLIERLHVAEADIEKILDELCMLYIKGAEIPWKDMYMGENVRKVNIPVYPFERMRYWPEPISMKDQMENKKKIKQPMIDSCLADSMFQSIYVTNFSTDRYWVLSDHRIMENNVLPGTAYLEMAMEAGIEHNIDMAMEIRDVNFLSPLVIKKNEIKEVQTIIKKEKNYLEFVIASSEQKSNKSFEESWVVHAEGKIYKSSRSELPLYNINEILDMCNKQEKKVDLSKETGVFSFGPRWWSSQNVFLGQNETLAVLEMPDEFSSDLGEYRLHPALLDCAVNITSQSLDEGVYLPLSYKNLKIFKPLTRKLYSYINVRDDAGNNMETVTFDILLLNEKGEVLADIEGYTVKKVRKNDMKLQKLLGRDWKYYETVWVTEALEKRKRNIKDGAVLIFKDRKGLWEQIIPGLKAEGRTVIEVDEGTAFKRTTDNKYTITATEEDYMELIETLKAMEICQVIHLSSISDMNSINNSNELEEAQRRGIYSLFFLIRALLNKGINGELDIVLISDYANKVTGMEESINPLGAALFGLGKVVGQEYPNLKCRCIDIDSNTRSIDIVAELMQEHGTYIVTYRNSNRYIEEFREIRLESAIKSEIDIRNSGVYVITGGIGGIGLEIGKYLASKNNVKLALINRSQMPGRDKWDEIIQDNRDEKLCTKIMALKELEALGAEVACYSADISHESEMKVLFEELRQKYGRINGIVHSAGVAGDGFLLRKEETEFRKVIDPKIKGTWVLDKLTKGDKTDFFVMFSSIVTLIGGVGQGDYTAANSFMDSYGAYRNILGRSTLIINWPAWSETGMAFNYGTAGKESLFGPITTESAIEAFDEMLNFGLERVIVGKMNYKLIKSINGELPIRISESIKSDIDRQETQSDGTNSAFEALPEKVRVNVKGKSDKSYTEIESKLAVIWAKVLGVNEIDIYDNFHDIGGDSILATRLLKEVEKVYPETINISNIFAYPSVIQLAEYINSKRSNYNKKSFVKEEAEDSSDVDLKKLLDELESGNISIENGMELLMERGKSEND